MILTLIVVFSALFVVTHLGMSHGAVRENLVAKLGEWPFRGVYSLVSFLTFGPAAVLWWQNRHLGPVLWELNPWVSRGIALVCMLIAIELIVLMLANPSPASMMPGSYEPHGIIHVTRHPMNMGLALFGLAHILANGTVGDVAFFATFVLLRVLRGETCFGFDSTPSSPSCSSWFNRFYFCPSDLWPFPGWEARKQVPSAPLEGWPFDSAAPRSGSKGSFLTMTS